MSTDTETDTEKKKKGRTGSPFYIQERYDRELELAPVKVVEEILSWQARENGNGTCSFARKQSTSQKRRLLKAT